MPRPFGCLMSILHRQTQIYINHTMREFNLTATEYAFLLCLYKEDGITQDALSAYLQIDKSATTRALSSLEGKGYVARSRDNTDKRFNRIFLTPEAKELSVQIKEKGKQWNDFLTEGFDFETLNVVISTLEKMVDKVEGKNWRKALGEL